jgi:exodeoxyribonuclease VII large subunit
MVDRLSEPEYSLSMEQMTLFDVSSHWTVGELTRHLHQLLDRDPGVQNIWVQGEISNLSRPASGHIYFTLKDNSAALRCVIWKNDAVHLKNLVQDGAAIEAHGSISIYDTAGQYQLYADDLHPLGQGVLFQEFLRLKALLEAEGLFDPARKRPIPQRPHRVGIITSATGAALRDMLQTLKRRLPIAEVILVPAPVQGGEAPLALVQALQELNDKGTPDVILIGRGGGSIEDLWAFNDERLVRAITESRAPVISGVGHETDFTLVDFAADLRAPTPTAAAELATRITILDLQQTVLELGLNLEDGLHRLFENHRNLLAGYQTSLGYHSPLQRVLNERQRLDELERVGNALVAHRLELSGARLRGLQNRLVALSPQAVLERGYAVVTKNERVVTSRSQVNDGDPLRVRVRDGDFDARVSGTG